MPRLPDTYAPLPVPQSSRAIASYDGTAVARAVAQMGATLGDIGERIERDQAIDETLAARRRLDDWEREARAKAATLKGRDAFSLPDTLAKDYDEAAGKVAAELTNPRSRRAFSKMAIARRAQVLDWAGNRASHEREVFQQNEFKANVESFIQNASDDPSRATAEHALATQEAQRYWRTQGLPAQDVDNRVREVSDQVHASVVKSLLVANQPVKAKEYFDKVKETLGVRVRGALDAEVRKVGDAIEASDNVQKTWAEMGPQGPNDPVKIADMSAKVRKDYAADPEKMKLALSSLAEMTNAHNKQQSETNAANTNAVVAAYGRGVPRAKLTALPEWRALPATEQQRITEHFDNREYQAIVRANANDARAIAQMQRQQQEIELKTGGAYLRYVDPAVLGSMSMSEVQALLPVLGQRRTEHLMALRTQLESREGKLSVGFDNDAFNKVAQEAGFKPNDPTKTEKQRNELGALRDAVDQAIASQQHQLKRVLTYDEKRKTMQRIVDDKVLLDEFGRDPEKPLGMLTAEDLKRAYVVVGGKEVKLASIPPADFAEGAAELRQAGVQPTAQNIAAWFVRKTSKRVSAGVVSGQ